MRMPELKSLTRDHWLRNCWIRKGELVSLLQNNGTPEDPGAPAPNTRPPPPLPRMSSSGALPRGALVDKKWTYLHNKK